MSSSSNHDNFVLRWNDFQANVANSFLDLRVEEDFFDVTLACDEDHQLQAHRVILAASSGFFRGMLKRNPVQHPVLVMPPNVRFSELANLLDFIYHGEVTVPNDELNSLLRLANLLKVKGLVDEREKAREATAGLQGGAKEGSRLVTQQQYQQQRVPKLPPGINVKKRQPSGDFESHSSTGGHPPAKQKYVPASSSHVGNKKDYLPPPPPPLPPPPQSSGDAGEHSHPYVRTETGVGVSQAAMEQQAEVESGQQQEMSAAISSHAPMDTEAAPPPPPLPPQQVEGTRFIALQCPKCPEQLPGTEAFKRHMEEGHPMLEQQQQKTSSKGLLPKKKGRPSATAMASMAAAGEENSGEQAACDICDKVFKSRRYVVAHKKRVHKILYRDMHSTEAGAVKKRGRPKKKKPEAESLPPPAAEEEGEQEETLYEEVLPRGGHEQKQQQQQGKQQEEAAKRPVGQVQPRPKPVAKQEHLHMQGDPLGMSSRRQDPLGSPRAAREETRQGDLRPGPSSGGCPGQRLRQQRPFAHHGGRGEGPAAATTATAAAVAGRAAGVPQQDLKRSLGLKFGGQISITSSEQQSSSPRHLPLGQGVSMYKGSVSLGSLLVQGSAKGRAAVLSKPHTQQSSQPQKQQCQPQQQHQQQQQPLQQEQPQPPVKVKQEPEEAEEASYEEGYEHEEEYGNDDFAGMEEYEMGEEEGEGMFDEEEGEEFMAAEGNIDDDDGVRDADFENEMGDEEDDQ